MKDDDQQAINDDSQESKIDLEQDKEASKLQNLESNHSMMIKVYSPFRVYFDGPGFSISGENKVGPFDILPGHHDFITLLNPCTLLIRYDKGDQKILISGGLMHVKADRVIVFLDV